MIDSDLPIFPNNVVMLMADRFAILDPDLEIFRRPLRRSDPIQCVGVFATQWTPEEDSQEVNGGLSSEPTLGRYMIAVQALIKNGDEIDGLMQHAVLSKLVRAMLYRDTTLAVELRSLSVDLMGSTERTQRYGIRNQRYVSNDVSGQWMYLSTLEFYLETESTDTV